MPPLPTLSPLRLTAILGTAVLALLVVACATRTQPSAPNQPAQPQPGTPPQANPQAPASSTLGAVAPTPQITRPAQPSAPSQATTAKAYRVDAARHLYALNTERIYKGVLPPNLYSISVLDVDVDRRGQVTATRWQRAPRRAEVAAEILRTVRAAAPYPVPNRMARGVTYTDVWLWDESGHFQLDTLTEGQR